MYTSCVVHFINYTDHDDRVTAWVYDKENVPSVAVIDVKIQGPATGETLACMSSTTRSSKSVQCPMLEDRAARSIVYGQ